MSNAIYPTLAGLSFDSTKSPMFNNIVQRSVSMNELRAAYASAPIYEIVLAYDILRDNVANNELKTIMGFYLARQGSFDNWLYLDPDDNTATLQAFGTGDGVTVAFQLARSYGSQTEMCANIGTGQIIYVNGAAKVAGTDYTINSTGVITFTAAPAMGAALTWSGTYYYRCRFNTDSTPISFNQFMSKLWELKTVDFLGSLGTKI